MANENGNLARFKVSTRFVLSLLGILLLGALAFFAMIKGDSVSAPMCITGIGTIVAGYQWGKTVNNSKYIENQIPTNG